MHENATLHRDRSVIGQRAVVDLHLAVVKQGPGAEGQCPAVTRALNRQRLTIRYQHGVARAWVVEVGFLRIVPCVAPAVAVVAGVCWLFACPARASVGAQPCVVVGLGAGMSGPGYEAQQRARGAKAVAEFLRHDYALSPLPAHRSDAGNHGLFLRNAPDPSSLARSVPQIRAMAMIVDQVRHMSRAKRKIRSRQRIQTRPRCLTPGRGVRGRLPAAAGIAFPRTPGAAGRDARTRLFR